MRSLSIVIQHTISERFPLLKKRGASILSRVKTARRHTFMLIFRTFDAPRLQWYTFLQPYDSEKDVRKPLSAACHRQREETRWVRTRSRVSLVWFSPGNPKPAPSIWIWTFRESGFITRTHDLQTDQLLHWSAEKVVSQRRPQILPGSHPYLIHPDEVIDVDIPKLGSRVWLRFWKTSKVLKFLVPIRYKLSLWGNLLCSISLEVTA